MAALSVTGQIAPAVSVDGVLLSPVHARRAASAISAELKVARSAVYGGHITQSQFASAVTQKSESVSLPHH